MILFNRVVYKAHLIYKIKKLIKNDIKNSIEL